MGTQARLLRARETEEGTPGMWHVEGLGLH